VTETEVFCREQRSGYLFNILLPPSLLEEVVLAADCLSVCLSVRL